jgi:hypothetical protein
MSAIISCQGEAKTKAKDNASRHSGKGVYNMEIAQTIEKRKMLKASERLD